MLLLYFFVTWSRDKFPSFIRIYFNISSHNSSQVWVRDVSNFYIINIHAIFYNYTHEKKVDLVRSGQIKFPDLTRSWFCRDLTRSTSDLTRSTLNMTRSTSELTRSRQNQDLVRFGNSIWLDLTRSIFFSRVVVELISKVSSISQYVKWWSCIISFCTALRGYTHSGFSRNWIFLNSNIVI